MIKELFINETENLTVKVVDGKIDALRTQKLTEKAVRVFDEENKLLALSAGIGEIDEKELEEKAKSLLSLGMSYNYDLEKDKQAEFSKVYESYTLESLEEKAKTVLNDLNQITDQFVFNGTVSAESLENTLQNSLGLNLKRHRSNLEFGFMMKMKGSGNIMDAYTGYGAFKFDDKEYAQFLKDTDFIAKACLSEPVSLENKNYKILFQPGQLLSKFKSDINSSQYEEKSSLFSDRLNEKIFHESVSIKEVYDNDELQCFVPYDHEGIIKEADLDLVKNGVLKTIIYDKKRASKYGKQTTGNGFRAYNSHPGPSLRAIDLYGDIELSSNLIADDIVILPFLSSGGDFLPNGNFSMPTQLAFVFKNGKFIGKAPQITITGNYLDSFNKDFIAIAKNDLIPEVLSKKLIYTNCKVNL
ncbi:MAG: metallopeptidase TldD-related protein [Candidatus Cloacimonetes bacterium]|nr:metallopeptidase TldD-related protein [Candidatus Cloacimonadota bacterium]